MLRHAQIPAGNVPSTRPIFVKLAESYGAKGIRVTKAEGYRLCSDGSKNTRTVPTVIEFIIEREANVLPMVPPGNPLSDMILEKEEQGE